MELLIAIVVILVIVVPIAVIISFFNTLRSLKDSLAEIKSDITASSLKISELTRLVRNLGPHYMISA